MSLVRWSDAYSVKVASCDSDHRKLFAIINELHDAMKVGKGSQVIQSSVGDLLEYTKYHFTREEAMLEKARYPELPTHRTQHRVFVGKVEQFQRDIKEGKTFSERRSGDVFTRLVGQPHPADGPTLLGAPERVRRTVA